MRSYSARLLTIILPVIILLPIGLQAQNRELVWADEFDGTQLDE